MDDKLIGVKYHGDDMNHRTILRLAACWSVAALVAACGPQEPPPATTAAVEGADTTLVTGARIYTMDAAGTVYENGALAIDASGRITAVGERDGLRAAYPAAELSDLGGATVLPGLIDAHAHLGGLAQSFTRANLVGARSKEEVLERLRDFEAGLPEGAWLLGRGWDQNDWPGQTFPDRHDLDRAFPGRPVWLRRIDGHAGWANSRAIAEADRDLGGEWQEEGGFIHRDPAGAPTGIFIDKAMDWIERVVPPDSPELMSRALDMATAAMVQQGLTGLHEAGTSLAMLDLYRAKVAAGELPVRIYAMADGLNEAFDWLCERGRQTKSDLKLGICGEHGGEPSSITCFASCGLDYVSCSPYRVPVARHAAARAALMSTE